MVRLWGLYRGKDIEKTEKHGKFGEIFVILRRETYQNMTALELNAELYRAMGEIANDETLLVKVLNFVKGLKSTKTKIEKSESGWANRFSGGWKDNRSTEEIINDIRESRTDNSREIDL